jgi:hypothetical protein
MCNMAIWALFLRKELAIVFFMVNYLATIFFKFEKLAILYIFFITNVATQTFEKFAFWQLMD